jgi:hypothetical protein
MKLSKNLFTILTVAGAVTLGSLAVAQEKKDEKPAGTAGTPPTPARPVTPPRDPSAAYVRFLNLSEEQKAKVKPILDQEAADLKVMREDKNIPAQTRLAKYKEIREATTAKIKPLLNEEQAQKWERIRNPRQPGLQPAAPGQAGQPPRPASPPAPPAAPKASPEK